MFLIEVIPRQDGLVFFAEEFGEGVAALFVLVFFWVVGFSNAINLTDGLDGLAIGCTITVALAPLPGEARLFLLARRFLAPRFVCPAGQFLAPGLFCLARLFLALVALLAPTAAAALG